MVIFDESIQYVLFEHAILYLRRDRWLSFSHVAQCPLFSLRVADIRQTAFCSCGETTLLAHGLSVLRWPNFWQDCDNYIKPQYYEWVEFEYRQQIQIQNLHEIILP